MRNQKAQPPANIKSSTNIGDIKYNFTLKQILAIASFVGTSIITIGYAMYSYMNTVQTIDVLKQNNVKIQTSIDTLSERTKVLKDRMDRYVKTTKDD